MTPRSADAIERVMRSSAWAQLKPNALRVYLVAIIAAEPGRSYSAPIGSFAAACGVYWRRIKPTLDQLQRMGLLRWSLDDAGPRQTVTVWTAEPAAPQS